MGILKSLEWTIGSALSPVKGHDKKLFYKTASALAEFPSPTFDLNSPECGPSGSHMLIHHTGFPNATKGELADQFPELTWDKPFPNVKEYVLIVEDADIPLPFVAIHGLYYAIPGDRTVITHADLEVEDENAAQKQLKGPVKLGKNVLSNVYGGPKPPCGHGPHRYFYSLVALKEEVDQSELSKLPTKNEMAKAIEGKVLGWGLWIGVYENKW